MSVAASLLKILPGLYPSEKWDASPRYLVLHCCRPDFVLAEPVSAEDRVTVTLLEEISIM